MDDICKEKHSSINEKLSTQDRRLNRHSEEIDIIKLDMIAQKKDTTHLQDAIKSLKYSIDLLIVEIGNLKSQPLEKYEKIGMVVMSAVIGYLVSKWF